MYSWLGDVMSIAVISILVSGAVAIIGVTIPAVTNALAGRSERLAERRSRYMELREAIYLDQIEWFKVLNSSINLHIGYHKGKEAPDAASKLLEKQASLTEEQYKLSARMSLYASDEATVLFDSMEQLLSTWFEQLLSDSPGKKKALEAMGMTIFEFEQELIIRLRREMSEFNAVSIGRRRIRLTGLRSGAPPDQALLVLQRVLKRVDEQLEEGAAQGGAAPAGAESTEEST
jgi:hypothetical protein